MNTRDAPRANREAKLQATAQPILREYCVWLSVCVWRKTAAELKEGAAYAETLAMGELDARSRIDSRCLWWQRRCN
jgi:hypothetical protein